NAFVPLARGELAAIDRELPISGVPTMEDVIGRSITQRRFVMLLLAAFGAVAVLLAAIGVYGVLAYVVSQRTREIGLRLAIGAAPADVVRLFVREGAALALIGVVCGVVGAVAARAGADDAAVRRHHDRSGDVHGRRRRDRGGRADGE